MVHDGQAVAERLGLFHVVRREDHGAPLALHPADHLPEGAPGLRVEARRGLVEEDELGIVHERQRHGQALLLTPESVTW